MLIMLTIDDALMLLAGFFFFFFYLRVQFQIILNSIQFLILCSKHPIPTIRKKDSLNNVREKNERYLFKRLLFMEMCFMLCTN